MLLSGLGGVPPGPPMPRPVLPRERGYLDRFIEYLVGDGPANRFALVCRQCESHNGMALKDEFQYLGEFGIVLFKSVHFFILFLTVSWVYLLYMSLSTLPEHLMAWSSLLHVNKSCEKLSTILPITIHFQRKNSVAFLVWWWTVVIISLWMYITSIYS